MLTNFHTHTTYCDGKNTPEEIVINAIGSKFSAIGFSGHGFTNFDRSYCMNDTDGYIREISRLREKYKKEIQIYIGTEEDMFQFVNRENCDYIIGSSHYFKINNKYYPIDLSNECFEKIIEVYDNDILKLSEDYYQNFCEYIIARKPDIVGHFDLITKYDELNNKRFLNNEKYKEIARKYIKEALKSECLFEVNTGAISRGYRKTPYPSEDLLHTIKKNNGKIILSSDSHSIDTLDYNFKETRKLLKEIGFQYTYTLYNNDFIKDYLD